MLSASREDLQQWEPTPASASKMFLDQKSNSLITYFRFADNEGTMNPQKIFPDEENTNQKYPYTFRVTVDNLYLATYTHCTFPGDDKDFSKTDFFENFKTSLLCCLCFFQGTFVFSIVKYKPLKFNKTYVYPTWAYALGWFLGLFCVLLVPLWIIFKVTTMKGTIWQVCTQ